MIVDDVRRARIRGQGLVLARQLHGTRCRCSFWDEVLDSKGDEFIIAAELVRAIRPMTVAVRPQEGGHKQELQGETARMSEFSEWRSASQEMIAKGDVGEHVA